MLRELASHHMAKNGLSRLRRRHRCV